jgi:hypothetical protein
MKKFFSTLLAASLMLIGTQAFAQVSVNAGYLNSSIKVGNNNPANANGAFAGVSFNVPLVGGLAVAPGVYYSMIASKNTASYSIASATGTFTEHAINVPAYLNYNIGLSPDTKFFIFGGPTFQYGLASTVKLDANIAGIGGSTTVDNYKDDDYNRMNLYLGGGVGFNVKGYMVTVGFDYGMMNQYKGNNAPNAHRSNIKIGVGYNF